MKIKPKILLLFIALAAANLLHATDFDDPADIFRFKGDVHVGTAGDADPVPGNLTINGRNSTDPVLNIRNQVLGQSVMQVDSQGRATVGGPRPSADTVSVLHTNGPVAIWPTADWTWTNARTTLALARNPENYFVMAIPQRNTAGLATIATNSSSPSEANRLIMAIENGSIYFKTGITYNGDWNTTGTTRMSIEPDGQLLLGAGLTAGTASQTVVGKYNDSRTNDGDVNHTEGVFIVGAGTSANSKANAMRVLADGTVLVKPSGDIGMGDFHNGPMP